MAVIEATTYPQNIFLVEDDNARVHCYHKDPMKSDAADREEIDLLDEIMAFYGRGNAVNPVIIQIRGARIERAGAFSLNFLEDFRLGRVTDHLEDMEGHVVEILTVRNRDTGYPLNGVILDRNGSMIEKRTFSSSGLCSDGDENHRLVTVKGPAVFEGEVQAGEKAEEEVSE